MSPRRLLVIALSAALAFTVAWLWRAAGDDRTDYQLVPPGAAVAFGQAGWHLTGLRVSTSVTDRYGTEHTPVDDAVLVLATLDYDATGRTEKLYCGFSLVAGDASWESETGFFPAEPRTWSCDAGTKGTIAALFEIPKTYLSRVQGVAVNVGVSPIPLLEGVPQ
jgi:hypothetical protein